MTMHERTGLRDMSYSAWHRPASIGRFLNNLNLEKHRVRLLDGPWCEYPDPGKKSLATQLGMIDIDHIVYDGKHFHDRKPVALIETARTINEEVPNKQATITAMLGQAAKIPVFVVLYQVSDLPNPADYRHNDIDWFFVRQYWPEKMFRYWQMTPEQYAWFLVRLRTKKGNVWQPPLHPEWPLLDETDIGRFALYYTEKRIA